MSSSDILATRAVVRSQDYARAVEAMASSLTHARDLVLITEDEYDTAVKWLDNHVDN